MVSRRRQEVVGTEWLHRQLVDLSQAVDLPAGSDVAPVVRTRLAGLPGRAGAPWGRLEALPPTLRYAGIALAILLAVAAALAITPGTRDALARFFGLKRVQIIFEEEQPPEATLPIVTAPAGPISTGFPPASSVTSTAEPSAPVVPATPVSVSPTPMPTPERTLSGRTTLQAARAQVPFQILVPSYPESANEPDEVYVQQFESPNEIQVILRYELFTLYQFRATGMFTKMVYAGTQVQEVRIDGNRGFWLQDASHLIEYRTSDGREIVEFRRQIVGNTLAWEVGDITYRLETALPIEEARKVAESLR